MSTSLPSMNILSTVKMIQMYQESASTTHFYPILLAIYSVVLVCGSVSLGLMMRAMKYSSITTTSIMVFNLIFAHFVFLFTVPFRIYYYAVDSWALSDYWCKVVSAMIHIHMYMSFVLYVIILVSRLLAFYKIDVVVSCYRRIHAVFASVVVWVIVLVTCPLIIHLYYGTHPNVNATGTERNNTKCFRFGEYMRTFEWGNYIISTVIICVATILTILQANILCILYRKYKTKSSSQQDFSAQLKSFFFALIMFASLTPYHMFRIYYLSHVDEEYINELFLSLTTLNCLDMLTFLGRKSCSICHKGEA